MGKEFGVFFGSIGGAPGTDYAALADRDRMRYYHGKGLTLVRLGFFWEHLQPTFFAPLAPDHVKGIRSVLDAAAATGQQVILEAHNHGRYPAYFPQPGKPLERKDTGAFADLWHRIAQEFEGHPGLYGYELMNEPDNLPEGPDAWAALAQAATDAIRKADTTPWVLIPGYGGQLTWNWPRNNPNLGIRDSAGKVLYAAHVYFDDWSGQYAHPYDASPGFPLRRVGAYQDIGVDRIKPFLEWLNLRNAKGIFTEYGIPDTDPRWLEVLDRFLAVLYASPRIVGGTYCEGGPLSEKGCGANGLSAEPVNDRDRPQMAVLGKYTSSASSLLPGRTPPFARQGPPWHETPHFAIWGDPDALASDELARAGDLLEKALGQVTSFLDINYDIAQKGRIPVYFRSAAGLSFTTPEGAIVFNGYKEALKAAPGLSMVHEVTHIITGRHRDYLIRHLDAPFLELRFFGSTTLPGCGFSLHQQAAALLEADRFIPIQEIPPAPLLWGFAPDGSLANPQQVHRSYTEAGSFGQYLLERYGVAALAELRSRPERAWAYAYGKSIDVLQKEWLEVLGEVREQNTALTRRLAEAAKTPDPCRASRLIRAR